MRTIKYWLPTLLWASVIFTFSSMMVKPTSEIYWQDFLVKKSAHFVEYFTLYILLFRSFKNTTKLNLSTIYILTLFLVALYAASDEYHQSFTPGREARLRDILIDSFAGVVAYICVWKYLPKAPEKLKTLANNLQIT